MEWECFQDMKNKGDWRVEAIDFDDEGALYVTIFSGPDARKRAREYVAMKSAQEALRLPIASSRVASARRPREIPVESYEQQRTGT
jgi:hypothetical protein